MPTSDITNKLTNIKKEAQKASTEAEYPKKNNEYWRFSNHRKISLEEYNNIENPSSKNDFKKSLKPFLKNSNKIAIINNKFENYDTKANSLISPLSNYKSSNNLPEDIFNGIKFHFSSEKYKNFALSNFNDNNSYIIDIPDNTNVDIPIEIFHYLDQKKSLSCPITIIWARKNSSITVLEHQMSDKNSQVMFLGSTILYLEEGAKVTYIRNQSLSKNSYSYNTSNEILNNNTNSNSLIINNGSKWIRNEIKCTIKGSDAKANINSLSLAKELNNFDQRTMQIHEKPGSISNLLFKNILFDQSKTIFSGLIKVAEGAHQTDAYQTCRNLLMSDQAEASSMPGLEILADQVKCSHGSTSNPIQPDEIYYMLSRGINNKIAHKLIAQGFAKETLDILEDKPLLNSLLDFIGKSLDTIN